MHDLVITLKDQLWLGSTRQPGYMLHAPTGPKFCLFLLYHKRFLRKVVFFYVRPWNDLKMANVTRVHQTVNIHATCPCRAQILLIFALQQAISEISDILGCMWLGVHHIHATCTHGAHILFIFTVRQAVSEISDILWCVTFKWPWKVKSDSGPPDSLCTCYMYWRGPKFAYFALGQAVSEISDIYRLVHTGVKCRTAQQFN